MEFNQLILEKLHSLFIDYGLEKTEQSTNIVKYESQELVIVLSHNPRENSNTLWVGRKHFNEVEIDNQVMREYFNSDLKLSNLPQETFINNVFLFFMGDGEKLLKGNERALVSLEKFNEQRSSEYTANLVEQQNLEAANKAWKEGNYSDVIKYLEKINDLPESFKQKYKIAQQKLGK
ncbi:hypothetical protein MM214_16965 [Belliella kenyensis]|uniref:hypothetical protein n=1 Tax=Belliella kenyensis TaxID=1472724 RepID=UPI0025B46559|nr:hypothetical protein [Belliella kenyensis]MCH7403557.1 hypothetical protein [Belliella kenyensis]MDN3604920.1 hypothetical protein [Belliella kenyensis]